MFLGAPWIFTVTEQLSSKNVQFSTFARKRHHHVFFFILPYSPGCVSICFWPMSSDMVDNVVIAYIEHTRPNPSSFQGHDQTGRPDGDHAGRDLLGSCRSFIIQPAIFVQGRKRPKSSITSFGACRRGNTLARILVSACLRFGE